MKYFFDSQVGRPSISDSQQQSMDFKGMIDYASQYPESRQSIGSIMISKFLIDTKRIAIEKSRYTTSLQYKIENEKIVIMDLDLAAKFVRIFGEWLTNIEFSYYNCKDDKCLELMILINQYCPNLIESELTTKWNNLLTKSFDKVKKLKFGGMDDENLVLQRIYPNMQELKLGHISQIGSSDIIQNYPTLKKLTYDFTSTEKYVESLVKENPQIESIKATTYPSFEFFQKHTNAKYQNT